LGESDTALDDLEAAFDKSGGQYANELRAHLEAALGRIARDPGASKRSEEAIRLRLAEVSAFGGDVESARAVVEELLQRSPQNAAAVAAMGRIEELSGRPEAAALTYARAVALASDAEVGALALRQFEVCRRIGRVALCRGGLEKAVQANPQDEAVRNALREVYEETGALLELSDLVVEDAQRAPDDDAKYDKLLEAARLLLYGSGEVSTGPAMAERALAIVEEARALETERSGLAPADLRGARRARSRRRSAGRARADDRCTPRQALQGARTALLLALSGRVQGRQPLGGARGAVEGAR
jgi:tetratricopeptide (TPR) repeat protein